MRTLGAMRPRSTLAKAKTHSRPAAASQVGAKSTVIGHANHEIRIIGGLWKRSKLKVLDKPGLREATVSQRIKRQMIRDVVGKGDSVEAVARENGAVIDALGPDGVAVFPADEPHTPLWRERAGARRVLTFALAHAEADVSADAVWSADHWAVALRTPAGSASFALRVAGLHNVKNALAAAACALAAGAPLDAAASGAQICPHHHQRAGCHERSAAGCPGGGTSGFGDAAIAGPGRYPIC